MENELKSKERGQAGIIVVLVMVVLLTVGLSISSRSVSDVRLSRQEEETTRAFDAAEAGVEEALTKDLSVLVGEGIQQQTFGGIETSYGVEEINEVGLELNEGETLEVILEGLVTGEGVRIEWADKAENCPVPAALVVSFITDVGEARRIPYDGCGARANDNKFVNTGISSGSPDYKFTRVVNLTSDNEDTLRVRAVYRKTKIKVSGETAPLPIQYWRVHSEARTLGGETRAVEVTRTRPAPPSIFDFVIFTGNSIIHN